MTETIKQVLIISCSLFLAGIAFASTENEEQYQLEGIADIINDTLNAVIKNLSDPLNIDDISLTFDNDTLLSGGVNVTKLRIAGIHEIVAPYIKVDIFTQMFNMTIDIASLDISFKYWLDTLIGTVVPLYGEGINSIFLEGIAVNVSGKVDVLALKFKNVTASLTIETAVFNMDGLLDNPEFSALVNLILDDNFCKFINEYQDFVSEVLSAAINAVLG